MKTSFACPTCRAPLIVKRVAAPSTEIEPTACPNPFCRTELPARHDQAALVYALVGTVSGFDQEHLPDL